MSFPVGVDSTFAAWWGCWSGAFEGGQVGPAGQGEPGPGAVFFRRSKTRRAVRARWRGGEQPQPWGFGFPPAGRVLGEGEQLSPGEQVAGELHWMVILVAENWGVPRGLGHARMEGGQSGGPASEGVVARDDDSVLVPA